MKHSIIMMKLFLFINTISLLASCINSNTANQVEKNLDKQIGTYIVEMFEDSKGNLWFGTLSNGIAKFDGKTLQYYTQNDGLSDNAVVSMVEEPNGTIWFGTHNGLTKYDGENFNQYYELDGLPHFRISNLLLDVNGRLWIGTWGGICVFDGKDFKHFEIPEPEVENPDYLTTMDWVTELMEDKNGNIWIGRDGYGATKYDGKNFTHYTKDDGLYSNNVMSIHIDKKDSLWIGTRIVENDHPNPQMREGNGGIQKYNGEKFVNFSSNESFRKTDNYALFEDSNGNFWLGANGIGLFKYDGVEFTFYNKTNRMDLTKRMGIQGLMEDSKGRLWVSISGGLFRIENSEIINITQNGPWN